MVKIWFALFKAKIKKNLVMEKTWFGLKLFKHQSKLLQPLDGFVTCPFWAIMWLTYVFFIVFGHKWSSVA